VFHKVLNETIASANVAVTKAFTKSEASWKQKGLYLYLTK